MEYKILTAQSFLSCTKAIQKLSELVKDAIALGWEPLGGVAVGDAGMVAQAMIKRR
jgi:hypothetical protein